MYIYTTNSIPSAQKEKTSRLLIQVMNENTNKFPVWLVNLVTTFDTLATRDNSFNTPLSPSLCLSQVDIGPRIRKSLITNKMLTF